MPPVDLRTLQKMMEGHFPSYLGIEFTHAENDVVRADLTVRQEISTMPMAVLHGGAVMSLAGKHCRMALHLCFRVFSR